MNSTLTHIGAGALTVPFGIGLALAALLVGAVNLSRRLISSPGVGKQQ